MKIYNKLIYYR